MEMKLFWLLFLISYFVIPSKSSNRKRKYFFEYCNEDKPECPDDSYCVIDEGDINGDCKRYPKCSNDEGCPPTHYCTRRTRGGGKNVCVTKEKKCNSNDECQGVYSNATAICVDVHGVKSCIREVSCDNHWRCPFNFHCRKDKNSQTGYCQPDKRCKSSNDCGDAGNFECVKLKGVKYCHPQNRDGSCDPREALPCGDGRFCGLEFSGLGSKFVCMDYIPEGGQCMKDTRSYRCKDGLTCVHPTTEAEMRSPEEMECRNVVVDNKDDPHSYIFECKWDSQCGEGRYCELFSSKHSENGEPSFVGYQRVRTIKGTYKCVNYAKLGESCAERRCDAYSFPVTCDAEKKKCLTELDKAPSSINR